ncbi:MAG: hydrogenase maturation protease [Gammaproteobacteria bacterium]|nr:hydrogenase maturation protease [Gammaproteobacteria bacterium]
MKRVLVIGIGSPFGDDRLGWEAAETLRRSGDISAATGGIIEISHLDHPGSLVTMPWRDTDCVILLDAVRSGALPGTPHCLAADELAGAGLACSSHGFGVAEAVGLIRALGGMPSRLWVRGIEADPSWAGMSLSPAVASALPAFCVAVAKEALELSFDHPTANANPA